MCLVVVFIDSIKIGKLISDLRKKNNLTQSDLANILNVTNQAVSKWENGRGIPDVELLKKLSEVFKIDMEELLDGELKDKKRKKYYILIITIIVLIGVLLFLVLKPKDESFHFSNLATDNDAFSIKGVMAYSKNKKAIYISEVNYKDKDEAKYKKAECLLLEKTDSYEKIISKFDTVEHEDFLLSELLKEVEFNVQNYECTCDFLVCNNLYLRINVTNLKDQVITYSIPIQIEPVCEK